MGMMSRVMLGLRSIWLTASVTAAFALARSAASAIGFEKTLREAASVASKHGVVIQKDYEAMADAAFNAAERTKFSNAEAASALGELAASGFNTKESIDSLQGTLYLAQATNTDLTESAKYQAATINQFGLEAKDAGRVADVFTQAINKSALKMDDLGYSMKYVGPVAKGLGSSLTDTVGTLAALSNVGIKGSQAGTSLRAGMLRLAAPTKMVRRGLDKMNASAKDFYGPKGLLPLPKLIDKMREKTKGLSVINKKAAIAQIVGREASSAWIALLDMAPGKIEKMVKAVDKSRGMAKKVAQDQQKTVGAQLERIQGIFESLIGRWLLANSGQLQEWLSSFADGLKSLADPASNAGKFIRTFGETLKQILRIGGKLVQGFAGPLAIAFVGIYYALKVLNPVLEFLGDHMDVIAPILLGFIGGFAAWKLISKGTTAIKGMSTAVKGLGTAFKTSMKGTIIGIIVALVYLFIELYQNNETFRKAVQATMAWIIMAGQKVVSAFVWIKDTAVIVWDWIKAHWPLLLAILFGPFGLATLKIIENWGKIKNFFINLPGKIGGWLASLPGLLYEWGKRAGTALINAIASAIRAAPGAIFDAVKSAVEGISIGGFDVGSDLMSLADRATPGASGGLVNTSGRFLVGEQGPELINLPTGSRIVPNEAIAASVGNWSSGGGLNITVPLIVDGRQIAEANHKASLQRAARR
jgi:TP901 family phage tail tape measure protein